MATYKQIFGKQVKFLSSDPDNEGEGQIWYNSTSNTFKTVLSGGSWSSAASMSTARNQMGSTGIQAAALAVAGQTSSYVNTVEEYNGSGWETGTVYPLSTVGPYATGTVTAGLAYGGLTHPPSVARTETFEFDGSTWTTSGALPVARGAGGSSGGFGSQTAAVQSGGRTAPAAQDTSSEYNGSTWTAGNTINTARYAQAAAGILSAGVIAGGAEPADSAAVEEYDGTNWTSVTSIPTATNTMGSANQGPQTSTIMFGGGNPDSNRTLSYDGTNWTTQGTLATARLGIGGAGASGTSGLGFGGYINPTTSQSALTEEYNFGTTVVTAAAWASGDTMNDARSNVQGARNGTQTSSLAFSGYPIPANMQKTEEYDGSTWTAKNNMVGTARYSGGGTGVVTAAITAGGALDPPAVTNLVEEFDGTDWTTATAITTARKGGTLVGTQTAAALCGGDVEPTTPRAPGVTEEYNGSTWSPGGTMNTARVTYNAGAGLQTAGLIWGGGTFPGFTNVTEEYDGTSWTSGNNYLITVVQGSGAGIQTAAFGAGGIEHPGTVTIGKTFTYDGTNWATAPSLGSARYTAGSAGTSSTGIVFGGNLNVPWPGATGVTEEFTAATTAANLKTITTS